MSFSSLLDLGVIKKLMIALLILLLAFFGGFILNIDHLGGLVDYLKQNEHKPDETATLAQETLRHFAILIVKLIELVKMLTSA